MDSIIRAIALVLLLVGLFQCPGEVTGAGVCGNGILEDQEACDCGSARSEGCWGKDTCCRALLCTLKEGAECSNSQPCCHNCKFKGRRTLCRKAESECDLPEYCSGKDAACPPNVFHRDGKNCSQDQGYCFKGFCRTHQQQCQLIYKDQPVTHAAKACYTTLNSVGDERGHCGNLRPCHAKDTLCGSLHCVEGKNEHPMFGPESFEQGHDDEKLNCTLLGMAPLVQDMTKCGPDKVCHKQRCVNMTEFIPTAKCPGWVDGQESECSNHGYCSNRLTCHCHRGWQGLYCSEVEHAEPSSGSTVPTKILAEIPLTRQEIGDTTSSHGKVKVITDVDVDTNYTLGMIFAIAVVTISIIFFLCALVYCYLFSSPVAKAKESIDSQVDEYSLDTNNSINLQQPYLPPTSPQHLEVTVTRIVESHTVVQESNGTTTPAALSETANKTIASETIAATSQVETVTASKPSSPPVLTQGTKKETKVEEAKLPPVEATAS